MMELIDRVNTTHPSQEKCPEGWVGVTRGFPEHLWLKLCNIRCTTQSTLRGALSRLQETPPVARPQHRSGMEIKILDWSLLWQRAVQP